MQLCLILVFASVEQHQELEPIEELSSENWRLQQPTKKIQGRIFYIKILLLIHFNSECLLISRLILMFLNLLILDY